MTKSEVAGFSVYKSKEKIIVDGSNLAYTELTHNGKPQAKNLVLVSKALEKLGYQPIIAVDSSLYFEISDQDNYEQLMNEGLIYEIPDAFDLAEQLLELSEEHQAKIVSNNLFEIYEDEFPWIESRTIPIHFQDGRVGLSNIKPADD